MDEPILLSSSAFIHFVYNKHYGKDVALLVAENKKDRQEWKPPNCLIYKPFGLVAGPGIEPGTS